MTSAKIMEKRDALKRERDLALREIGEELVAGCKQLNERAERARKQVWVEFKRQMAELK